MASFQDRVIGALQLHTATFEDVEHDATATTQAAVVVVAAAVSGALASLRYGGAALVGIVMTAILAVIGWAVGALVLWFVGTRILPGRDTEADYGQLLRTVGFAQAPGLFGIVAIVPFFGLFVRLAIVIWSLVAGIIAVRQALDYDDTIRAVIVCVIAWAIMFVATLLAGILGFGATMVAGHFAG
jgi:hypothetical protein